MAKESKIEWTDHTFNPWVGCTKVSSACDHCYAETWAKRAGTPELWTGERRRTTEANWKQPLKWNREHEKFYAEHGRRQRVFCASLADVFDNQVPDKWRADLWEMIRKTPNLDWLLLTKRPQNIKKMLPPDWGYGYPNVWLGTTVENQQMAERRVPILISIPAVVKFLSMEPLLGPVNLDLQRCDTHDRDHAEVHDGEEICIECAADGFTGDMPIGHWLNYNGGITWVITGGESGTGARATNPDWFRSIRDQCDNAGVAFHFKQWGEWTVGRRMQEIELPLILEEAVDGILTMTTVDPPVDAGKQWFATVDREGRAFELVRVGKAKAGRLLDGREWNEYPEV